jgi:hypothetical protein
MARKKHERNVALERRWRELIAAQARSGLSIREFCESRELREPNFYAWRRELAKRDAGAAKVVAPTFVPVQILPSAAIEVTWPTGVVVRVPAGADGDLAVRLVTALRAASC